MGDNENELVNGPDRRKETEPPAATEVRRPQPISSSRPVPVGRLLAFYAVLVGVGYTLALYFPIFLEAWVSSPVVQTGAATGRDIFARTINTGTSNRAATVLLVTIGALALSLPVAWVYTFTRRLRYDPSLVHSVIILPMVVSGIVVVVKDSIALAFSLAGIVAVVRFRNTLKDPKDAVYIFLALGIGLAAGVQAIDIALVMSMMFNLVVLILFKFNLGAMYGETQRDILSIGNRSFMIARSASQRDAIRWRVSQEGRDMDTDGILLVHTHDPEPARQRVELTLSKVADDWRLVDNFRRRNGIATFAVLLKLNDKKGDPLALLAELDERWAQDISAAEYLPFRKEADEDDNDDDE